MTSTAVAGTAELVALIALCSCFQIAYAGIARVWQTLLGEEVLFLFRVLHQDGVMGNFGAFQRVDEQARTHHVDRLVRVPNFPSR